MWTAQKGHTEVAKLLLERGADPITKVKVLNLASYIYYIAYDYEFSHQAGFTHLVKMVN